MPSSLNGTGVTFNDGTTLQSGNIPAANLGSGTANSTTFLRGDRTWQTINTTPTTDQVLTATAGASFGAVGTYAFLSRIGQTSATFVQGSNYAGSVLAPAGLLRDSTGDVNTDGSNGINGTRDGIGIGGTWKCMGRSGSDNTRDMKMTLFLRIS